MARGPMQLHRLKAGPVDKSRLNVFLLQIKRSCFTLHVVGGYLYAVGGLTPGGYTATVERLDRRGKRWEMAAAIPDTRYRCS